MKAVGNIAEDLVACYCRKLGFIVLARQWRIHRIEVDILALAPTQNSTLLIEVKKIKKQSYLEGYPAISERQILRYRRAALWLGERSGRLSDIHFYLFLVDEEHHIEQIQVF